MPDGTDARQMGELLEAVRKLTTTTEQVAGSLANLEALCTVLLRKQDEDRAEAKERQKKFDEAHEEVKERLKKWDKMSWTKNPWLVPEQLGNFLLVVVLAALAITVLLQVKH